jgi:hypothetical protein
MDPVLLLIVKDPVSDPSVKSPVVIVPATCSVVQNSVVLFGTSVVDTVNVTVCPSFTVVGDGVIEYVGGVVDVSIIVTVGLVATIGPVKELRRRTIRKLSGPSVIWSAAIPRMIVA